MEIGFTYGPCDCAPFESEAGAAILGPVGAYFPTKKSAAREFLSMQKEGKKPRVHYVEDGIARHIVEVWVDGEKRG